MGSPFEEDWTMIIEDSRDTISYVSSKHHVSFKIVKANGEEGTISHFGGDNWFGTGCFEGYSREYLKAFYRDFSADYNELMTTKNKQITFEQHVRAYAGMIVFLAVFLAMICAVSITSFYGQELTFKQAMTKIEEIWFLYVIPVGGMIAAYLRLRFHRKKALEQELKFEKVSEECNLKF